MNPKDFEQMLEQVALAYDTTPDSLRKNILHTIENSQSGHREGIPLSGDTVPLPSGCLTFEDYVEFLARTLSHPFEP